jgi:asparagine synthase (glutamine-hydrolysing)
VCGISGAISVQSNLKISDAWQMVALGSHRGPDGSQLAVASGEEFQQVDVNLSGESSSWCILGHSRLTILGLSEESNQPFLSSDGRYAMVFNGEIYNFLEIRSELQKIGVVFNTDGDTEVLFRALMTWGQDALPKLRGMFSFAFADNQSKKILLARDRFGIKPLHIFFHESTVYFASEIKQFTDLETWKPEVHEEVALEFLLYGVTDHRKESFFRNVQKLLPGHLVEVSLEQEVKFEFRNWVVEEQTPKLKQYASSTRQYRDAFIKSVEMHLRSDVEVGSCLSGGLDSSAIVGVVSDLIRPRSMHTFTATSELNSINEKNYADAVIESCQTSPHFVEPSARQLLDELKSLVWHQDEPFGTTSIFAQWCVFKLVRDSDIKVVLDGQGADEQLAGYNSFLMTFLISLLRRGRLIQFVKQLHKLSKAKRIRKLDLLKFFVYQVIPAKVSARAGQILGIASQNGGYWIREQTLDSFEVNDPFKRNGKVPTTVEELCVQMIQSSNLPMLLRFEDRNSMAHGVEARVPFVDDELMKFVGALRDDFLIDGTYTKKILRDALSDFIPPLIRNRRDKIGFQTAEEIWMTENAPSFKQLVEESVSTCARFFDENTLRLCNEIIDGEKPFSNVPWRVISFGQWAKVFKVEGCK